MERPDPSTIEQRWKDVLADPLLSITRLRERGIRGDLSVDHLRSLHWRIYLGQLPPPSASTSPGAQAAASPTSWPIALDQSRGEWEALRNQFLRAPDGQLVDDGDGTELVGLGMTRGSSGGRRVDKGSVMEDLGVNNPLSQDKANPWTDWFGDLELRKTIRQDVTRTFPEIEYFRRPAVQDQMTNILHVMSKLNDDVGYRQGMHELLGPILFAIDHDSLEDLPAGSASSLMHQTLSRRHVEHDTYSLFSILMRSAKSDYEFNPTVPIPINSPSVPSRSAFGESPTLSAGPSLTSGAPGTKLVQPIVEKCCRIFDNSLRRVDVELWQRLEEMRIEPQIWGIRWIRLLFTREFSLDDALKLWDGIFAYDPTLRLVEFVCVAMLLRVREALLDADYSTALQILLRYPAPADGNQRLSLLLRQAIYLQANPTSDAGAEVRRQNRDLDAEAGELTGSRALEESRYARRGQQRTPTGGRTPVRHSVAVPPTSAAPNLSDLGDLAKNALLERAEAFGLPKVLNSAFSDFKRTYGNAPGSSNGSSPTMLGGDHKVQRQLAEDLSAIKASNEAMAEALGTCVAVLESDFAGKSEGSGSGDEAGRLMVVTALRHVQDVLGGKAPIFDARVMAPIRQRQRSLAGPSGGTLTATNRKASASGSAGGSRRGSAPAVKTTFAMPAAPAPAHRQDEVRRGSVASAPAPNPSASEGSPALSIPPTPPTKSPLLTYKPPSVPSTVRIHDSPNNAWSSVTGTSARPRWASSNLAEDEGDGRERKPLPDPLGVWTA